MESPPRTLSKTGKMSVRAVRLGRSDVVNHRDCPARPPKAAKSGKEVIVPLKTPPMVRSPSMVVIAGYIARHTPRGINVGGLRPYNRFALAERRRLL